MCELVKLTPLIEIKKAIHETLRNWVYKVNPKYDGKKLIV